MRERGRSDPPERPCVPREWVGEFARAYGNDWFLVPLPLPVGSLVRVIACSVRDTFGIDTPVRRSRDAGGVPWSLFELSTDAGAPEYLRDLFFLAPTLPASLAGDPIESS